MRNLRIYVDTSVFGGTQDEEFAEPSRRFFAQATTHCHLILISRTVTEELHGAPEAVRSILKNIPENLVEYIEHSNDISRLAEAYVHEGVLGKSSIADALHVAAASIAEADVILSWNFKHIVNFDRIRMYNAVNMLNGFSTLEIRTPAEMAYDNQDKNI